MIVKRILGFLSLLFVVIFDVSFAANSDSGATTLATFNTAMVESVVENVNGRATVLIDQMSQSDVDIFCLQEVWEANLQRRIYSELSEIYPYVVSAIDIESVSNSTATACKNNESDAYFNCREDQCAGLSGGSLTVCGILRCRIEFSNVSEECSLCLAYEASVTNTTECSTLLASNYEQTFGLMIISKKELKNPTADRFNNHSMIRGFLTASVDNVGDLICTHLTTVFAPPPLYVGPPILPQFLYTSYAEQQADEIMTLLNFIESKSMNVPILMGDFNHGPAGGLSSQFPLLYGLMNAQGFVSPYVLKDGRCTFCTENPLTNNAVDELVDHIYITTDTIDRVVHAMRFYDEEFPSLESSISDHYATRVTLTNIREKCNYLQMFRFHCVSEIKEFSPFQPDFTEVCFN